MFNDLREFIEMAEQSGECRIVEEADWDTEIGVITHLAAEMPNPPLLVFDRIKGYDAGYRVASSLYTTPKRTALGLNLPPGLKGIALVKALRDRLNEGIEHIPPVEVETGPVKENILTGDDIDLFRFPAPKWHELDGGRYIGTGTMGISRDPDEGWINIGTYRTQIHDKCTVTAGMVPGHHGEIIRKKYWEKGLSCPIAICCGQDPTLWATSHWTGVPWGVSEYEFAGGLRGEPVEVTRGVTTDLLIPATAEIVLEGEIMPPDVSSKNEGPLGEWCGYYAAGIRSMPAVKITSILHRNNPIIQGNPPHRLPSLWSLGFHLQKAAALTASGCNAINFCCRCIIVVDDDVDPSNISEVLWALGTRIDPENSIDILHGCTGGASDPMLSPEKKRAAKYQMSRAVIIACRPYHWRDESPKALDPSPGLVKEIREKWKDILS